MVSKTKTKRLILSYVLSQIIKLTTDTPVRWDFVNTVNFFATVTVLAIVFKSLKWRNPLHSAIDRNMTDAI